jgi:hypothetical protein
VIALYVLGSLYALWLGYVLTMNIILALLIGAVGGAAWMYLWMEK